MTNLIDKYSRRINFLKEIISADKDYLEKIGELFYKKVVLMFRELNTIINNKYSNISKEVYYKFYNITKKETPFDVLDELNYDSGIEDGVIKEKKEL